MLLKVFGDDANALRDIRRVRLDMNFRFLWRLVRGTDPSEFC